MISDTIIIVKATALRKSTTRPLTRLILLTRLAGRTLCIIIIRVARNYAIVTIIAHFTNAASRR